jgi:hypothetical protein
VAHDDTGELLVTLVDTVGTTLQNTSEEAWFAEFARLVTRLICDIAQMDTNPRRHENRVRQEPF